MEVPIREMKNRLSRYLKLVQSGSDVVIADRGRPVAVGANRPVNQG